MSETKFGLVASIILVFATFGESVFAQGPPLLPEPILVRNYWRFDDTNFISARGFAPKALNGVQLVSSWDTNAAQLSGAGPAYLSYNVVETNSHTNIAAVGSLWMWFRPQFDGPNGPGGSARLLEIESFRPKPTVSEPTAGFHCI